MKLFGNLLICASALLLAPAAHAAGSGKSENAAPAQSDFDRGEALIKSGAYEEAIQVFRGIVRDNPNEPDSLFYLGYASEKMLNLKTAFQFYAFAVKADPDHKRAHEALGRLFLRAGDLKSANEQLDELRRICTMPCDERQRLAANISTYKDMVANGQIVPNDKGAKGKTPAANDMDDLTTLPP